MKDNLNILMYEDVGYFLKGENLKYIVAKNDDHLFVRDIPLTIKDAISDMKNNFAYDFDELSPLHQEKYQHQSKALYKADNNIYHFGIKSYQIKRNNRP